MKKSSLLTPWLLSCFLFFFSNLLSQERIETGKELAQKFSTIINRPDVCEGYPYLSADGLRLYFTTDREGGFGRLYSCSRNSVAENFGAPKPLSENLPDGYYAATLTADELTIYTTFEGNIYSAKRRALTDQFSEPVKVEGLAEGRKYAPAISQDGNELIIIQDDEESNDVAVHYRKNAGGNFIEVNRMQAPKKVDIDPGQFSKDGLSFYASYETTGQDKSVSSVGEDIQAYTQKIIRFKRNSLTENFTASEEVKELSSPMRNHQPTMNEDESIFVVTNSAADLWSANELRLISFNKELQEEDDYLVKIDTASINNPFVCYLPLPTNQEALKKLDIEYYPLCILDMEFDTTIFIEFCEWSTASIAYLGEVLPENSVQVKVYPNPFTNNIVIDLNKNELSPTFDLYDISGRKVLTTKLNNVTNRIQFNQPGTGVYIYKLTNKTGKVIASGKLVKR